VRPENEPRQMLWFCFFLFPFFARSISLTADITNSTQMKNPNNDKRPTTTMQPNEHNYEFRHMPASSNNGGNDREWGPLSMNRTQQRQVGSIDSKWSSATDIRTQQRQFAPNNSESHPTTAVYTQPNRRSNRTNTLRFDSTPPIDTTHRQHRPSTTDPTQPRIQPCQHTQLRFDNTPPIDNTAHRKHTVH